MVVLLCYYDVMGVESVHFFFICRVHMGLFCSTPGVALGLVVNRKRALKMLLTGDPIFAWIQPATLLKATLIHGVFFHVFKIVQMVPNRVNHLIIFIKKGRFLKLDAVFA